MCRLFPILLREKFRRYKKFIIEKPFLAIGILSSVVYLMVCVFTNPIYISDFLNNPVIVFIIMAYLTAKIINPTQGMTLDYQLLELKFLSLAEYKLLLSVKLLGGSILLSAVCLNSYTEMAAIISALNIVVNVWIFLRNRWNNRIYDLLIAVFVVFCMKYQALYLSVLSMLLILGIYMRIKRVNYESILSLYKLIYKIGQQRYHGAVYSETESRDIQTSAETLVGKAKEKRADWCERFFEQSRKFMLYKELARIVANFSKIVTYFIICILIGMSRFYIPGEYRIVAFLLLAAVAMSFDMVMNRLEANLLLRGYTERYVVLDIIKNKLPVYSVVNFVFLFPAALLGWKWLIWAVVCSPFIALFSLYKCFRA